MSFGDLPRMVFRAVIDDDDLECGMRLAANALKSLVNRFSYIVSWNDDGHDVRRIT